MEQQAQIIKLRGRYKPSEIAKKYKIGLTRLYKIWTDASNDHHFPGGLAGTQAGQNLTKKINTINEEIKKNVRHVKLCGLNLIK